jgi:hypothetical protein
LLLLSTIGQTPINALLKVSGYEDKAILRIKVADTATRILKCEDFQQIFNSFFIDSY